MENTEKWPQSKEHILRKDNCDMPNPKGLGVHPGRGPKRGLDPGGRLEETQATLTYSPCGQGSSYRLPAAG